MDKKYDVSSLINKQCNRCQIAVPFGVITPLLIPYNTTSLGVLFLIYYSVYYNITVYHNIIRETENDPRRLSHNPNYSDISTFFITSSLILLPFLPRHIFPSPSRHTPQCFWWRGERFDSSQPPIKKSWMLLQLLSRPTFYFLTPLRVGLSENSLCYSETTDQWMREEGWWQGSGVYGPPCFYPVSLEQDLIEISTASGLCWSCC